MLRRPLHASLPLLTLLVVACGGKVDEPTDPPHLASDDLGTQARADLAPPMLGMHLTRDEAAAHSGATGGRSPLLAYHGGKILATYAAQAVYWGPSWSNSTFVGDKMTGLASFYTGHSGSDYAITVDEYTDTIGTGHQVGPTGTFAGGVVDTSAASISTSNVLAEVCKLIAAGSLTPDPAGISYFPVYTDVKRGRKSYCAWHSYGSCAYQGATVALQFGFFFDLDGDAGCDPQDTSGLHSQGLAALANVSAHELSETRSDPSSPAAWMDSSGNENGDKCAWTFGAPLVTFTDGSQWKLQGEWSNAAYTAGTGYPNASGQKGCLSGL